MTSNNELVNKNMADKEIDLYESSRTWHDSRLVTNSVVHYTSTIALLISKVAPYLTV